MLIIFSFVYRSSHMRPDRCAMPGPKKKASSEEENRRRQQHEEEDEESSSSETDELQEPQEEPAKGLNPKAMASPGPDKVAVLEVDRAPTPVPGKAGRAQVALHEERARHLLWWTTSLVAGRSGTAAGSAVAAAGTDVAGASARAARKGGWTRALSILCDFGTRTPTRSPSRASLGAAAGKTTILARSRTRTRASRRRSARPRLLRN